jgi:hypothetical protein
MSIRLIRLSYVFALSLLAAFALSCKGGGGGQFADVCDEFAETQVGCLEFPQPAAKQLIKDECIDELEESDELDGDACADAQIAAFECLIEDVEITGTCDNFLEFFNLDMNDLFQPNPPSAICIEPELPFCDSEIRLVEELCQASVQFVGNPDCERAS